MCLRETERGCSTHASVIDSQFRLTSPLSSLFVFLPLTFALSVFPLAFRIPFLSIYSSISLQIVLFLQLEQIESFLQPECLKNGISGDLFVCACSCRHCICFAEEDWWSDWYNRYLHNLMAIYVSFTVAVVCCCYKFLLKYAPLWEQCNSLLHRRPRIKNMIDETLSWKINVSCLFFSQTPNIPFFLFNIFTLTSFSVNFEFCYDDKHANKCITFHISAHVAAMWEDFHHNCNYRKTTEVEGQHSYNGC